MLPDRVSNPGPLTQVPYRLRYAARHAKNVSINMLELYPLHR